ncbi:Cytosolic 10-formyltetrahydrofolate dehydrogenase [Geodia barretti]|uniref:10-formyltetrahydrofolate dehydrogenase n=1 Tax=Geodia barretti TaxID=519541 RepID=A0AA35XKW7_GEOBA|nr:Cytosolic 10-formyltetrahydrofolate dehydrogenase [Geodia barretti]
MTSLSLAAVGARLRLGARLLAPSRHLWAASTANRGGELRISPPSVAASYSRLHTTARLAQYRAKGEMRIAVIGQSLFGQEVYRLLRQQGHNVVAVFTVPDDPVTGRPDPLAEQATSDTLPVLKYSRWRKKKVSIPEVLEEYKSFGADLNVLPFCTQFIPMDVINFPKHGSIIYHPSLLPRHRGASAINWTLMEGDSRQGSLYSGQTTGWTLDPFSSRESGEAVRMIEDGCAPSVPQWEGGATYDQLWQNKDLAQIEWDQPALGIHNFIRGNDKIPGAWTHVQGQKVTLYGSRYVDDREPVAGEEMEVDGMTSPAVLNEDGIYFFGSDGKKVLVTQLQLPGGHMIRAHMYGQTRETGKTGSEPGGGGDGGDSARLVEGHPISQQHRGPIRTSSGVERALMDVTRLVEEVRDATEVDLETDDVYMNPTFEEFTRVMVLKNRGGDEAGFEYHPAVLHANNREIHFPHQIFINGQFVDSISGKTYQPINPTTEQPICDISASGAEDVEVAIQAAQRAFDSGPWRTMNARDRGKILYRLADLMEEHKEELATLETVDSGAVYTLALKTHVGFSVDTFRYYAGWCDKIQGSTIPINNARPNSNLCFTRKEPLGVCGIVVPWNYPLMMVAWKVGACLAAGNTVVLKPAEVTPLTALKFAELTARAGFPKGVVNIVPGKGRVVGQAMTDSYIVKKVGFTGSTAVGKTVMKSAAESNVKKVSLELGGKSPLIIFNDCDLDKAVRLGAQSVFFNKGENCIAAGRLFVERGIHDEFLDRMVEEVRKMKIGDPLDRSTAHGPQNHKAHLDSLLDYCEQGVKEGAKLVYGGKRLDRPGMLMGSFEEPMPQNMDWHLVSSHNDINKALHVSEKLDAGTVFINTYNKTDVAAPFGGFKMSGFGKDLGEEALNEYLRTKVVTVEY